MLACPTMALREIWRGARHLTTLRQVHKATITIRWDENTHLSTGSLEQTSYRSGGESDHIHGWKLSDDGRSRRGRQDDQACFLDQHGEIVEERRLKATDAGLRRRFSGEPRYRIILEAGLHSPWMSHLLLGLGHEVYVANPRRLRAILREREQERSGRRPVSGPHRASRSDAALPLASPLS
jgi:hypothetical protein